MHGWKNKRKATDLCARSHFYDTSWSLWLAGRCSCGLYQAGRQWDVPLRAPACSAKKILKWVEDLKCKIKLWVSFWRGFLSLHCMCNTLVRFVSPNSSHFMSHVLSLRCHLPHFLPWFLFVSNSFLLPPCVYMVCVSLSPVCFCPVVCPSHSPKS